MLKISHTLAAWRKHPDQMKLSPSQNSIAFVDTRDSEYHSKMKVNPVLKNGNGTVEMANPCYASRCPS